MGEFIDRVFLTVFARYRRKLATSSGNSAWVRAVGKTTGFLILPLTAAVFVLIELVYLFTGWGTPADHLNWGKATSVATWLATAFLLQARFTKYLRDPPSLPAEESPSDRRIVLWFRVVSAGIFVAVCVTEFLLGGTGASEHLGSIDVNVFCGEGRCAAFEPTCVVDRS